MGRIDRGDWERTAGLFSRNKNGEILSGVERIVFKKVYRFLIIYSACDICSVIEKSNSVFTDQHFGLGLFPHLKDISHMEYVIDQ